MVAALTIPTLMQKIDRRDRVSKVKAAYSQLSQAMKMAETLNGTIDKWVGVTNQDVFSNAEEYSKYGLNATDWVGFKYILDEFKILKVCPHSLECLPYSEYDFLDGSGSTGAPPLGALVTAQLPNGMSIRIYNDGRACSSVVRCAAVNFDVMGKKSNHVMCKDYFEFNLYSNKVTTRAAEDEDGNPTGSGADVDGQYSCTAYIIRNNNMDYLDNY